MTSTDLKKLLKSAGIGGLFGRGLRLFDNEYATCSLDEMDRRVAAAMSHLAAEGIEPVAGYAVSGADCDNFSLWAMSEVTKQWALEHRGQESFPALAFGRCLVPGHDLNIAVTEQGVFCYNYGQRTDWNLKEISEVEFK